MNDVTKFGKSPATERDPRWAELLRREAVPNATFFYGVRTTGVYCRPSCAARLPRPHNVAFFETCAEAEAAGLRPCKRCRPGLPSLAEEQAEIVARLCRRIEACETPPSLDRLAAEAGLSAHHFHRVFKAVTGLTPKAYADATRARRVREELRVAASVTDAVYGAGYGSGGRFYAEADAVLGMTPTAYRAGGADALIRFATGASSLGTVLVAESTRGVCAILLGETAAALETELRALFPKARCLAGERDFEERVATVIGIVESPGIGRDLPLDLRGTAFQERVWRALGEIPVGTTASYAEIARRIGAPRAARAVAAACAANRLAVAVPCHRVVRGDGAISGYRWGRERKAALIERERVNLAETPAQPSSPKP